jgi:Ca2+-binding EF-hand superfamily protein
VCVVDCTYLSHESEHRLKNLLIAVGDGERNLEASRQRLCQIRTFAPHSAFQRIDRDACARIRSHDLLNFLRDHHNHSANEGETHQLVKFFDSDNDGSLSFQE